MLKPFILVTINKNVIKGKMKWCICEATPKIEVEVKVGDHFDESAVTQIFILRHSNYLNDLVKANMYDKIL